MFAYRGAKHRCVKPLFIFLDLRLRSPQRVQSLHGNLLPTATITTSGIALAIESAKSAASAWPGGNGIIERLIVPSVNDPSWAWVVPRNTNNNRQTKMRVLRSMLGPGSCFGLRGIESGWACQTRLSREMIMFQLTRVQRDSEGAKLG